MAILSDINIDVELCSIAQMEKKEYMDKDKKKVSELESRKNGREVRKKRER